MNPDYQRIFSLFWDNGYRAYTAARHPVAVAPADVRSWVCNRFCDSGTFNYLFVAPDGRLD